MKLGYRDYHPHRPVPDVSVGNLNFFTFSVVIGDTRTEEGIRPKILLLLFSNDKKFKFSVV